MDEFTPTPADQVYKSAEFKATRQRLSPVQKYIGIQQRLANLTEGTPPTPAPAPTAKTAAKPTKPE